MGTTSCPHSRHAFFSTTKLERSATRIRLNFSNSNGRINESRSTLPLAIPTSLFFPPLASIFYPSFSSPFSRSTVRWPTFSIIPVSLFSPPLCICRRKMNLLIAYAQNTVGLNLKKDISCKKSAWTFFIVSPKFNFIFTVIVTQPSALSLSIQ